MKRKASMVLVTVLMASGVGAMGASQASARDCQYNTRSCNWEPTKALCAENARIINLPQYRGIKVQNLPEPFKGRFKSCAASSWKSRG
ncbi:hypothetical protein [Streptomyces sp. NPDC090021]|uniref:hypothetical protein n=1 Tax=Streptomyces sp. NPDC090021 TaxID=3365919 RepID=UPI0038119BE5